MTAREILAKAPTMGHPIVLRPSGPVMLGENPPAWLVEEARAHKREIVFLLADDEISRLSDEASRLQPLVDCPDTPPNGLANYEAILDRIGEVSRLLAEYDEGERRWFRGGWVLISSTLLDRQLVCIVRDPSIVPAPGARAYPRYTFAEVRALDGASHDQVRQAHRVRSVMRGTIKPSDRASAADAGMEAMA